MDPGSWCDANCLHRWQLHCRATFWSHLNSHSFHQSRETFPQSAQMRLRVHRLDKCRAMVLGCRWLAAKPIDDLWPGCGSALFQGANVVGAQSLRHALDTFPNSSPALFSMQGAMPVKTIGLSHLEDGLEFRGLG
ncbi:hypothetical protein CLAIMM_14835 [Cladophialophora immunda]|nr:hypothetical protein CLAIMM_14835 [Cladophialophora immunda]